MSYCRFENTLSDMLDCLDAAQTMEYRDGKFGNEHYEDWMEKPEFEAISEYEDRAIRQMASVASELADRLNELLEED